MKNYYHRFERVEDLLRFYWRLGAVRLHYDIQKGIVNVEFSNHRETAVVTGPQVINSGSQLDMLHSFRQRYEAGQFELPVFSELLARCGVARITYAFGIGMLTMYNPAGDLLVAQNEFARKKRAKNDGL